MFKLTACVFIVAVSPQCLQGQEASPKVRVLIIDGQNNHDWQKTTASTRATLLASGRFEVDVASSPADREARDEWESWAPPFSEYDVVFSNYNDGGSCLWSDRAKRGLVDFVSGGGGLVVIHAADNSSSDWPEYNRMIGVGGWGGRTPASGRHLRRVDGAWTTDLAPDGLSGSHGPQHEFLVESSDVEHPVMEGLPTRWLHAQDELYDSLRGPCENVTVLASAYCERTDRHEPVILAIAYDKGRVFHTTMGHVGGTTAVHCVGFQTVISRGTEWAATGAVTIPVPNDFPTPEASRVRAPAVPADLRGAR